MKKWIMTGTALLIILSLFSGCASMGNLQPGRNTPQPGPTDTTAAVSETPAATPSASPSDESPDEMPNTLGVVELTIETYTYASKYIKVTIEVPQLNELADTTVQDSINAVFKAVMLEAQNDVKPAEAESKQLMDNNQTVGAYEIFISYSVPYNQNGFLSLSLSDYRYLGGAHGGDIRSSYTYDLKSGKQLSLGDLMVKDSGYRDMINNSIKKAIEDKVAVGELYELAPFEDIGDNPNYYLTQDAIVFYFQQYEYFPYAAGIQEFPILFTDLLGMLKKEYAVLAFKPVILKTDTENKLTVGDIGQIALSGNPTTGYTWHYTVDDSRMLELSNTQYHTEAQEGALGAGGTYIWNFRALKAGTTTITFKYYRDWLGEADAAPEDNLNYTVIVK